MSIEPRVRFIEHRGKQILFHDFSDIKNPSLAFEVIAQSRAIMDTQQPQSALTLTYVRNARFNKDIVEALSNLAKRNKPYVKAAALVGVTGLLRVIYVTFTHLSGRQLTIFDTLEAAKDWLVTRE